MVVLNKIKDTKTTPEGKNTNHLSIAQTEKCKECRKEFELKNNKNTKLCKSCKMEYYKSQQIKRKRINIDDLN